MSTHFAWQSLQTWQRSLPRSPAKSTPDIWQPLRTRYGSESLQQRRAKTAAPAHRVGTAGYGARLGAIWPIRPAGSLQVREYRTRRQLALTPKQDPQQAPRK